MSKTKFDKYLAPKGKTVKVVIYQLPEHLNEWLKSVAKERKCTVQKVLHAVIQAAKES